MNTSDQKIADVLAKFGEPMAGNVWRVQGTAVIYHKALERIAAQAKIQFDTPSIVRAERDEAVILVTGRMGERMEWSIGEALIGTNYRVSGRQAAYVYAMAEKRGKDRVILKLIELHGLVYSEEEADEFRRGQPATVHAVHEEFHDSEPFDEVTEAEGDLKRRIDAAESVNAVTDLMLDTETQQILNAMPQGTRDEVRDYAKARLVALGWPQRNKSNRRAAAA